MTMHSDLDDLDITIIILRRHVRHGDAERVRRIVDELMKRPLPQEALSAIERLIERTPMSLEIRAHLERLALTHYCQ